MALQPFNQSRQPPVRVNAPFAPPMLSPSLDGRAIGQVEPNDSTRLAIKNALDGAKTAAEKCRVQSLTIHADVSVESEAARHLRAHAVTFRTSNAAMPALDAARQRLETELATLKAITSSPPPDLCVRGNFQSVEVRQRLANIPPAKRLAALHKAVEEGDDGVIESALSGASFLTGLNATEREHLRASWAQKRPPDAMNRIRQLEADAAHLERGGKILQDYWLKCSSPEIVALAKRTQAAAAKAAGA